MFKDNLRYSRLKKGMTQQELASRLYVTRQSVSKWEQGINEPDIETLKSLCSVLGVTLEFMLSDNSVEDKSFNLNRTLLFYNLLTAFFSILTVFVLLRFLPEVIPAHWTHGQVDRYGKKYEILLHLITFLIFAATDFIVYEFCKRGREKKSVILFHVICLVLTVSYEIFILVIHSLSVSDANLMSYIVCVMLAFFLSIFLAMSPYVTPPNKLLGIRTAFTLGNGAVWKKINGFACVWLSVTTLPVLALNMVFVSVWALMSFLLYIIPTIAIAVYYRRLQTK